MEISKITSSGDIGIIKDEEIIKEAKNLIKRIKNLKKKIKEGVFEETEIIDEPEKIEQEIKKLEDAYKKGKEVLDKLNKYLDEFKDLEIYNETDEQLWKNCEEDIKNSNIEKGRLLTDLNKKEEELKETEKNFKVLDEIKKKLDNEVKPALNKLAVQKGNDKFFTTLLIISAILFGIFLAKIIVKPSLLFYILALLSLISMAVSGIFKLQFIRNKLRIKRKFENIKLTLSELKLSAKRFNSGSAGDIEEIEEIIQKFDELYHKKSEELQEIRRKLENEIRNLHEKISKIEKRIEDVNKKIDEIKIKSKVESLEKYTQKLERKKSLEKSIRTQEHILAKLFGEKSEKLEENISYWEDKISELNRKKQDLEENLKIQKEIKDIKQKAGEILQSQLKCETLKGLKVIEVIENLIKDFIQKNTQPKTRIESPYLQIDLDETKVFLIIPKQQFKTKANDISQPLYYKLQLNEEEKTIQAKITKEKNDNAIIEEIKIKLDSPIKNFKITYPDELEGRSYEYHHATDIFYIFIAIGNNRGRMYYLYDKQAKINPLPKNRDIWILIKEGFDLAIQPDSIEETWIWEKYRPVRINLKNTNELVIKNNQTEEENKIPCEISFSIQCDKLVEDDFKEQNPIFVGDTVKIIAPVKNEEGWIVLIWNKQAGYKIINENWEGDNPLELKLPDDLPCECGEFQIDICKSEDTFPVETLFFRYIPNLQLEYPRELIIPDLNTGHKQEIIKIILENEPSNWDLKIVKNLRYKQMINGYEIELPPNQDTLRFSLVKKDKPEIETNFQITVPRLRWQTSNMTNMADKPLQIKRDELISGSDIYLFASTNDFKTEYDFKAILEVNGQKLQEEKFTRKGMMYALLLNKFYDTIRENHGKVKLSIVIPKANGTGVLAQVEVIYFEEVIQPPLLEDISYDLINVLSLPKICSILRKIKATRPKEKLVCKDILQIYYQNIRRGKKAKRDVSMDKKDFVIKALSFIKFIMDSYGKEVQIKGQKKWRKRTDFLQQKYSEEFDNAYNKFSRR